MEMTDVDLCSRLFVRWTFRCMNPSNDDSYYDGSSDYSKESFIARVLRKKLEVFNVPVKVPDELLMIIEVCTGGNPGISQLMLKEIIGKNCPKDKVLTHEDFVRAFTMEFPVISVYPKWEKHFSGAWDKQKDENGNNLCDTPLWWLECFN